MTNKSPAQICGDILVWWAKAFLLLFLMPIAFVGWLFILTIDSIGDSRAWAMFARFWWGRPQHGR